MQLKKIMARVEEIAIQAEVDHVRAHARQVRGDGEARREWRVQVLLMFIGAHPDGRDVEKLVNFMLAQLDYEVGRG